MMAGKYKAYPEYKDSGVECLGSIPILWSVLPIKKVSKIRNGSTPKSEVNLYWDGNISWVTPADLGKSKSPYISEGARNISLAGYESCGTSLVPEGTILLSSRAPIGTLCIAAKELCTNQGCKSLVVDKQYNNKYLFYVLLSSTEQLNLLGRGTTFLELSADELGSYKIGVPSTPEQEIVANFLDHETAKIDTLINEQQRLIKLLKEKRQAVISHAVTKGLNPNARMRDSGVEWLGKVPEHWEVKRLKFTCDLITIKTSTNNKNVIALENIEGWTGKYIETNSEYNGEDVAFICGDILFSKLRPYLAKVYIATDDGVALGDLLVYRPGKDVLSEYCFYQMLSDEFISTINSSTYGSKMPRTSAEFIGDTYFLIPPLIEQEQIVEELKEKLQIFEKLTDKSKIAIALMLERRTALISAVVNGKIDVRNWQPPESFQNIKKINEEHTT